MPKPFPAEFRADVVRVARVSDSPAAQIARDFGISESCLYNWMKQADVDDGVTAGVPSEVEAELQGLRARNKKLEAENEILRRAAAFFAKEISPK